jgi:hypothetical protein
MTRSMNSVIFAVLRQSARIRYPSLRTVFLFVIMTVPLGAHASAATNEAEARALFTKFVAAQNVHSVSGVKAMLWNSPGTLLLARGAEIRGPGAIADRFKEYYEGTWHVEPDMSLFHVTLISKDVDAVSGPRRFYARASRPTFTRQQISGHPDARSRCKRLAYCFHHFDPKHATQVVAVGRNN